MPSPSTIVGTAVGLKVLLLDDSGADRLLFEEMFSSVRTWELAATQDAEAALERIRGGWPDAVLLDLHMVPEDGFAVLRRIRADPACSGVPVVMYSTSRHQEDRDEASRLGADGYVPKPATKQGYEAAAGSIEAAVSACTAGSAA